MFILGCERSATFDRRDSRGVALDRGSPRTSRRRLRQCGLALLAFLVDASFHDGRAASAARTGSVRTGALTDSWGPTPQTVGLRDGLLALGYREGEQFAIGVRFTQGDPEALPAAAQDLVQSGVDVIFAVDANAARAAQMATSQIPIVFVSAVGDPVERGLVQSFARPGGNVTGVTGTDIELAAKRLELFKEMLPGLRRVLFLYNRNEGHAAETARVYRDGARQLGLVLVERLREHPWPHPGRHLQASHPDHVRGIVSLSSAAG
jgi:ABC-type sugar transport system substrate-binding protein